MSESAKPTGRPPLDIDPEQVRKLAEIGCRTEEIADIVGCSRDTLERRFAAEMRLGRATVKRAIRQTQLRVALGDDKRGIKPNTPMLIFLGKNLLGQSDSPEPEESGDEPYERPASMTDEGAE